MDLSKSQRLEVQVSSSPLILTWLAGNRNLICCALGISPATHAMTLHPCLAQLQMKDEEIEGLKKRLIEVQGTRLKTEVNMASQESLIKALQQRQEVEKAAKYKAMYAVAERSKSLDECSKQSLLLQEGLAMCHRDLDALQQRR